MADLDELLLQHTFLVSNGDDDYVAAFVIDGREYSDPAAVRADVSEAFYALQECRIAAEHLVVSVDPEAPKSNLPSWQEYRESLQ